MACNPTHESSKLSQRCPPKKKKELQAFLEIINYLGKFSPSTAEICKPLWKLMSVKTEWTLNAMYQKMFNKAKAIIKGDTCMKFYDDTKPLYIEPDASQVGQGAALLQTGNNTTCPKNEAPDNSIPRHIAFTSQSLTRASKRYSNIEGEALAILYGLDKIPPLLFHERGKYNNRSQTTSHSI